MSQNTDSLAPHSAEAEEAVLGSALLDSLTVMRDLRWLTPDDFYSIHNAWIWGAMQALWRQGGEVDYLILAAELERAGRLEEVGGVKYLLELVSKTPSALNAHSYARIVQYTAHCRQAIGLANRVAQLAYSEPPPDQFYTTYASIRNEMLAIAPSEGEILTNKQVLSETYDRVVLAQQGRLTSQMPLGFEELDSRLLLERGQLFYLTAFPGMGKSAFACQVAWNWAARHAFPVLMVPLESTKPILQARMVAQQFGIPLTSLLRGGLDDGQFERFAREAVPQMENLPIYWYHRPRQRRDSRRKLSVGEIYDATADLLEQVPVRAVVIDTVNKLLTGVNLHAEMTGISSELAALAQELNVLVVGVFQQKRREEGKPAIPKLDRMRESGSVEQDADVVVGVYRSDYDKDKGYITDAQRPTYCGQGEAALIILKNRDDEADIPITFRFNAPFVRYESRNMVRLDDLVAQRLEEEQEDA